MSQPAVFLDRDGTLNEEVRYLANADQLVLINGAAEAVRALNQAGFVVAVITNQSGIARGYFSEESLHHVHTALRSMLQDQGAELDAIYFCPHHPTAGTPPYQCACQCRKPQPGMLLRAAEELNLDLAHSYIVGDKLIDVEAGKRSGCTSILVRTGYGREVERELAGQPTPASFVADDLRQAASWILAQQS